MSSLSVAVPIYPEVPEAPRRCVDELLTQLRPVRNWKVRKKTLMDSFTALDFLLTLPEEERQSLAEGGRATLERLLHQAGPAHVHGPGCGHDHDHDHDEDGDGEAKDEQDLNGAVLLLILSATLEQLAESQIVCAEQAAFYMLSAHKAHRLAALQWLRGNHRNVRDFRKLVNTDRRFGKMLERFSFAAITDAEAQALLAEVPEAGS